MYIILITMVPADLYYPIFLLRQDSSNTIPKEHRDLELHKEQQTLSFSAKLAYFHTHRVNSSELQVEHVSWCQTDKTLQVFLHSQYFYHFSKE